MSIEAALATVAEALTANTQQMAIIAMNQERLIAGQEAALSKVEAAAAGKTATRTRAKKEDAAPETPATTTTETTDAGYKLPVLADVDAVKAYATAFLDSGDADKRPARVQFLKDVAAHFNGSGFAGVLAGGPKAVFFIERAKALGTDKVSFDADYDVDGDPSQEVTAPAAAEDDFG